MDQNRIEAAISRVILKLKQDTGDDPGRWEMDLSPICVLDMESYELLVSRTGQVRYSIFFTRAIRSIKEMVTVDQLAQVMEGVKKNRSGSRYKNVRAKVGRPELRWVIEMAIAMHTKPARVMEAVLYLYLRAED